MESEIIIQKENILKAYNQTSEEQKAIDIDKAWSLAYSMYQIGRDNLIPLTKDEFIKAMED